MMSGTREMVLERTKIRGGRWQKIYREYTSSEIVNVAKVTQNKSYSHFHVPVPDKSAERSLILGEQRLSHQCWEGKCTQWPLKSLIR